MKKLFTFLLSWCCVLFLIPNVAYAQGADESISIEEKLNNENYRNYIKTLYDVERLSSEFNVDPDQLIDKIIEGDSSSKFSPFSEIDVIGGNNNTEVSDISVTRSEHIVYNQDSTAYLGTGNPGASGTMPWVGSCAVQRANSSTTAPLIPFGTSVMYMNRYVSIGGKSYGTFVVNDTGDPNFKRSLYWTDLYFGSNTQANKQAALNYGLHSDITLYWLR